MKIFHSNNLSDSNCKLKGKNGSGKKKKIFHHHGCDWFQAVFVTGAVITYHLSHFVLISGEMLLLQHQHNDLRFNVIGCDPWLYLFLWGCLWTVTGQRRCGCRKWQPGQELPCNLIPLRFVFIHSMSWQIMLERKKARRDDKWERKRRGQKGRREVDGTIKLQSGQQWEKTRVVPQCSSWIWCHDSLSLILLWNTQGFLMKCVCLSMCVYGRKSMWKCICFASVLCRSQAHIWHNDFLITPARGCRGTAVPVGRSDRNKPLTSCAVSLDETKLADT